MLENKDQSRTSLSQLGEFGLIEHLTKNFSITHESTLKSIGDDAAVLDFGDKKAVIPSNNSSKASKGKRFETATETVI